MDDYGVILTHSTGHSLRAEKVLSEAGVETKMIPVPRHLSSDCGVALRIRRRDRESALKILTEKGVQYDRYEQL
jgi:hypothetical protein